MYALHSQEESKKKKESGAKVTFEDLLMHTLQT